MSTEAGVGIYFSIKHVAIAAGTAIAASFAGWKMFFTGKIKQLDKVDAKLASIDTQLNSHISSEEGWQKGIDGRIDKLVERFDALLHTMAMQRRD